MLVQIFARPDVSGITNLNTQGIVRQGGVFMVGMWKLFSAPFPGVSGGERESPLEARKTPKQGHTSIGHLIILADEGGIAQIRMLGNCNAEIL